jgi:acyl phosphate:glycerol-3-phosphate acyltransferase
MLTNVRSSLAVIAATGYLVGSVPVANLVARRHGVADLREVGDRNPGYWNARATLGVGAARPVLVGDVAKGAVAAAVGASIGSATGGPWWSASLGGGAAMVGHAYPVVAGGRGGRSVLTFVGTSLVAAPAASAAALVAFGIAWRATGRFDRAARFGVAAFPAIQLIVDGPRRTAVSGALMTFVGFRFAIAWLSDRRDDHATSASGRSAR